MLKSIMLLTALTLLVRIPSYGQIFLVHKTDTVSCYTNFEVDKIAKQSIRVKEQDSLLKIETALNNNLIQQVDKLETVIAKDSLIKNELEAKNEITLLAYSNEKKQRETTEKALAKSNRQRNRWRTLTGIVGASGIVAYILK